LHNRAVLTIPDPAVIVLIGPSGAGKSTWAAEYYRAQEIVSSDALRDVVGSGEHDLAASDDAFALLDLIIAPRMRRGLTTVIDTLGLDPTRRRGYLDAAQRAGLPAVAIAFNTAAAECRRRNSFRHRPVPVAVLDAQLQRMTAVSHETSEEGWQAVLVAGPGVDARLEPAHTPGVAQAQARQQNEPRELGFVLQISRFRWQDDPAGWLGSIVSAAAEAGFEGIALMDHLIQIPQVGRAWEPIPEPWVTLGMVAALNTRLRLGTLVTPVTYRAPGMLAKTVATLDALSGGRAFCGIGAGWWDREHAAFGLPFPPAAQRLDDLEVAIDTMRALWRPGTKAVHTDHISLPETTCYPRPVGNVPIIVGGSGERRTLRIAARLGDACNLASDLHTLDHKIAVLRNHCAEVGRDPAEVQVTVLDVPIVGRDREHTAALVEGLRGGTPAPAFARRHHAGSTSDHIGRYRQLADRGVATVFVSLPDLAGADEVLRMAPVVSAFG
jgi:alkanesulfonate monooxygenase SsuD/methylene tetrahydromethanopterin reductase-like flavin-dependent oxidoreductase (luciferase family)/predicted kinase